MAKRLKITAFVLFISIGISAAAGPEPGAECQEEQYDLKLCDSANTLMGCEWKSGSPGKECKCLSYGEIPLVGIVVSMQWNETKGKCVSLAGSICNRVLGASNQVPTRNNNFITVTSLDCKGDMLCNPEEGYPADLGTCGSTSLAVFNGLILGSALTLTIMRISLW